MSSHPQPAFDLAWVRAQFPALKLEVNGRPAVYFDGPGGTQTVQTVLSAMSRYMLSGNSNTHGAFLTSERTDETIAEAHAAMADMLGCDPDEVFFGANMTSNTLALSRALGREINAGDEIIVTRLDHEANVSPWRLMAEDRGAKIVYVDIDERDCTLRMDDLAAKLNSKTKIVAVGYASNAVGTINDVAEVARLAHKVGALVHVDAVHYAPHGPIDVRAIDCDFLACSTYKFFGPHQGVTYGKREHLARLRPYKLRVSSDELPDRWETGTQNHEAMAGVVAAIEYIARIGQTISGKTGSRREGIVAAYKAIQHYERTLAEHMLLGLSQIPGLKLYGIADAAHFDRRTPTFAVRIDGHTPRELSEKLGREGIFTWDGNYYAIGLTERLDLEDKGGMLRIGIAHYNTAEEVDRCVEALRAIATR